MAYILRDPFARQELHRRVVCTQQTCDWCGNVRMRNKKPVKVLFLFAYSTESDDGRKYLHKGLFCSKPCHDSYHDS